MVPSWDTLVLGYWLLRFSDGLQSMLEGDSLKGLVTSLERWTKIERVLKMIQVLASTLYPCSSGSRTEFWLARLYGNALSLINMMTLHHRGLLAFLSWNQMEHVCLEDFGRPRQLLSLSLQSGLCVALELFYLFIFTLTLQCFHKWELSELTHHFPFNTTSCSGPPHIRALYSHSPGCPGSISKPLVILHFSLPSWYTSVRQMRQNM